MSGNKDKLNVNILFPFLLPFLLHKKCFPPVANNLAWHKPTTPVNFYAYVECIKIF